MSGPGFTPGPWFAVGARVLARSKNQLDEDEALSIADVDMDVRIDVDGEGAVNAALIAAAPELYEALAFIFEHISDPERGPRDLYPAFGLHSSRAIDKARAALAKARGETP